MKMDTVKDGYEKIARAYADNRKELRTGKYVREFARLVKKGGEILDVGCGPGILVDDYLTKSGFLVTGIDFSEQMIKIAKANCPNCAYSIRDMRTLQPNEYHVNGIVCLYTMFHIPREEHQKMLSIFDSYLSANEPLLITMGDMDFEGEHEMLNTLMWSSQWGAEKNTKLVMQAGFEIIKTEMDNSGRERHQIILARKRG